MKVLLIVIDGMGDIGEKTPLEEANTPNMDFLAMLGKTGIYYPLKGIAPGSGEAMLSILGYNPKEYYPGRGPLEALGLGHRIKRGELALRGDLCTFYNGKIIDRRAGGISNKEGKELAKYLDRHVLITDTNVKVLHAINHRINVILSYKKPLGDKISTNDEEYEILLSDHDIELLNAKNTFSPYTPKPIVPLENTESNKKSAELLNQFISKSYALLNNHYLNKERIKSKKLPANFVILRGAGNKLLNPKNIREKTKKLWAMIAEMPLEIGVAKYIGMEVLNVEKKDNIIDSLNEKIEVLKENWDEYDAFYFYIKSPDIYGHLGDFDGKKHSLELIDKHFFYRLTDEFDLKDVLIVVTADHSTPVSLKRHSSNPVPLLIFGPNVSKDKVEKFGENFCKEGELGVVEGTQLMDLIVKFSRNES